MGDPVALLLGLEDLAARARCRRARCAIIWSSSLAALQGVLRRPRRRGRRRCGREGGARTRHRGQPTEVRASGQPQLRQPRSRAAPRRASRGARAAPPARCAAVAVHGPPRPDAVGAELPGVGVVGEAALERRRAARLAASASSTGVTSSTRLSRLRGIRSAEPMQTRVSLAALEGVDPRVLEEAADDRDDADVLRDPGHPGPQAQMPAHVEVDLDAGLRGAVERPDAAARRPASSSSAGSAPGRSRRVGLDRPLDLARRSRRAG